MTIQVPAIDRLSRILERHPRPTLRRRPDQLGPPGLPITGAGRNMLRAIAGGGSGPPVRPKRDPVLVLVNRITQGFNLAEYDRARSMGYDAYLEEQLDHLSIDDSAMDARLAGFTSLSMSPKEIIDNFPTDITLPYYEVKGAALLRSVFSKRQLFERMVEFWTDHLNVDHNKGDFMYPFKPEEDRVVMRPHALGTFPELLTADAHNAAMLFYLDNWLNFAGAIQENYARELMELHTMGVSGGYTEGDIIEVAKCFTGWTLNGDYASANYLRALFVDDYHQGGNKTVLGVTIPAFPPRQNAQRVLDILVAHPSTAQFVSRKLINRFLNENPPQSFVDQVAQVFLDTNGDIKSVLRTILARENLLWNSQVLGPKFRRPFHLMTSILRGLDAEISDFYYSLFYLYAMAHAPFDWSPPTGYPDTVNVWGNSLLPRWTYLSHLMEGYVYGVSLSFGHIQDLVDATGPSWRVDLAKRINGRVLGESLSAADIGLLQQFIDSFGGPVNTTKLYEILALAASMPGYQWY